jgi:hypothetical protein
MTKQYESTEYILKLVENLVDIISPEIPVLPDIDINEEWQWFKNKPKKPKISITNFKVIEIKCASQAIAWIICDRLLLDVENNNKYLDWGIEEIHIFIGDREPIKIYTSI